ncbi:hypothetical protein [Micromonospora sp. DT47]|uniref:hypothetical protein n=1 Tax=Micromonospora sp. DT47 TaxID=3393431 RepID=UPI003CF78A12
MYHPKRPTPLSYGIAGAICTAGTIAVFARVLHNFTPFTLAEPFDTLTFAVGATYAVAGPFLGAWLAIKVSRRENAALRAQVDRMRDERRTFDSLVEHIEKVDAQAEVTTVVVRKLLKAMEEKAAEEDTVFLAKLHSINGGGGA